MDFYQKLPTLGDPIKITINQTTILNFPKYEEDAWNTVCKIHTERSEGLYVIQGEYINHWISESEGGYAWN